MLILWQKAVSNQDCFALLDFSVESVFRLGLEIDWDDGRFEWLGCSRHSCRRREIESFMGECWIILIQLFGKGHGFFTSQKLLTLAPTRFRLGSPRDDERIFHNAISLAVLIAMGNGQ